MFEVTNWFQSPIVDPITGQMKQFDVSIKQIEDYVNGKIPMTYLPGETDGTTGAPQLKWISVKWASEKAFAKMFIQENKEKWNGDKFFIMQRVKAGYFEF